MITNTQSGTNIDEIAAGIFRINTPVPLPDGLAFNFNQYLIVDDAPMVFHTGLRQLFPLVSEAIRAVLPLERLRYVGLSHFQADECGALNELLAAAPNAVPVCSQVAALVSLGDYADRVTLERLARKAPTTLAVMHGSAWRGDGARLLRELAALLGNTSLPLPA